MKTIRLIKMPINLPSDTPDYFFDRDKSLRVNDYIGSQLSLRFTGEITCINCDRAIKKTFQQGYCFPCFRSLAACDSCVVRPELCHYHKGTCRDEAWGEANCFIPHTLYLANSSGLKVGITRSANPVTRWVDQGATQGIAIGLVSTRLQAGLIEVKLKDNFADKTNWRKMLQGAADPIDLAAKRAELLASGADWLEEVETASSDPVSINYPVESYLEKISSFNFDKTPEVAGKLLGIKGQYLIFDSGVINIRKFAGYHVEVEAS